MFVLSVESMILPGVVVVSRFTFAPAFQSEDLVSIKLHVERTTLTGEIVADVFVRVPARKSVSEVSVCSYVCASNC